MAVITTPEYANALGTHPLQRWKFSTLNNMLLAVGQSGIDYSDDIRDTIEGQHALRILTDTLYDVQSEGWAFNTYNDYKFTLDANGKLLLDSTNLPDGATSVLEAANDDGLILLHSSGRILEKQEEYDALNDSTVLGEAGEEFTINKLIVDNWQSMPLPLAQYIAAKATLELQTLLVGDESKYRYSQEDIRDAYNNARRSEGRHGNFNMLGGDFGRDLKSKRIG